MAANLRWRAEEIARRKGGPSPQDPGPLSPEESQRTIHELRVHQIELKMQNEELRRVQAELEAMRAHYFDLYDLAPVGYCIISLEGLILEANLMAVTLLGATRSTLIKQPITRFILEADQDIYYMHRKELFKSNAPHACELRMVHKDGTPFWVSLSATPPSSTGDTAEAPACRLVLSDITERKRVEDENARLLAQLQQTGISRPAKPKAPGTGGRNAT
jgi:PAS domain S-box-containing protein